VPQHLVIYNCVDETSLIHRLNIQSKHTHLTAHSEDDVFYKFKYEDRTIIVNRSEVDLIITFFINSKHFPSSKVPKFENNYGVMAHRFLYKRNYFLIHRGGICDSFDSLDELLIREPANLTYYNDAGVKSDNWTIVVGERHGW
jgi:hypothetical protein